LLQKNNSQHLLAEIQKKINGAKVDENDRVPLQLVTEDVNITAAITREPNLGLKIVSLIDLETIPLYKTVKHSTNIILSYSEKIPLHIFLKLLVRYFKVITEVVTIDVEEYPNKIIIKLIANMPEIVSHHQVEGVALGIYRILNKFYSLKADRVKFSHALPSKNLEIYQQTLGVTPEFEQGIDSLEFSIPHVESDETDHSYYLLSSLQNLLNLEFPNTSYTERCHHILKCLLSLGDPKRESIAKVLNLSVSSLQRRLKEEGSSFKAVLLTARKQLAHEYLISQKRSINDTAFLLGYQSAIQFSTAFKKWFGLPPSQYKKGDIESRKH